MGVYIKGRLVSVVSYDSDASAFITAANIVDTYQKNAINQLVVNLKAAGIWSKMKAIYPFVGGTAFSHKWNLKNPLDTNAAFRLQFFGGWSHTSQGAQPNGTNGYADTFLVQSSEFANDNNIHLSYYSRTDVLANSLEIGCYDNVRACQILIRNAGIFPNGTRTFINNVTESNFTDSNSLGFYTTNRIGTSVKIFKNNTLSSSVTNTANGRTTISFYIGAQNFFGLNLPSSKQCAFSSIGDGLTDAEALVFNQIIETYQYALYRNVNPVNQNYYNTLYQNETNTFLYSSEITDNTQKNAINTLVSDLKTAGIWTKMKAVYPFVGGTASTHKWNLINPQDTDAAFRLTFAGGWIHSSTGAKPNGVNGFANTYFSPATSALLNSHHFSLYLRQNESSKCQFGATINNAGLNGSASFLNFSGNSVYGINQIGYTAGFSDNDIKAFYIASRTASNILKIFRNNTLKGTHSNISTSLINVNYYIGHWNSPGVNVYFSAAENAFSTIGDGLLDSEAADFYTAVQNFNTTLNRQV
jgi:hypothetical protein